MEKVTKRAKAAKPKAKSTIKTTVNDASVDAFIAKLGNPGREKDAHMAVLKKIVEGGLAAIRKKWPVTAA